MQVYDKALSEEQIQVILKNTRRVVGECLIETNYYALEACIFWWPNKLFWSEGGL